MRILRLTDGGKRLAIAATVLAGLSIWPSYADTGKDNFIGVVMEKTGAWTMKTNTGSVRPINENDSVLEGAELIPGSDADTIKVLLVDKTVISRTGRQDRMKKVCLSAAPSTFDRWYKALQYLHENPERFVFTIRGSVAKLTDGIALLDGGKVDFGPIFANAKAGSFRIQLRKVGSDLTALGPKTKAIGLEWDEKQAVAEESADLTDGLWKLSTLDQSDEPQDVCWVLICGKDSYASNCKTFQDAEGVMKSATKDDGLKRKLLLNYLASMAQPASEPSEHFEAK